MNGLRLVGMTQGSRKRAARIEAWHLTPELLSPVLRRDFLSSEMDAETASDYRTMRRLYRIGQRLRPCLGCSQCNAVIRDAIYGQRSEYDAPIIEDGPCGGSFVVDRQTAGRASVVRRERRFA